jgi:small-conductance mechanosensitive channel
MVSKQHPYDVGDRVFVGTENWTVVEIDLLTTTFKKWDGTTLYAHNTVIAPQYICNLRRSGPMAEVIGM